MCRIKNKGFTIVEMAVVIVVIGIILMLSVQVADIYATAKIRNEMGKIVKLEAAFHNYYTANGGTLPNFRTTTVADEETLIIDGYIALEDIKSFYGGKWLYHKCGLSSTEFIDNTTTESYMTMGGMLCLRKDDSKVKKGVACLTEITLDDKNLFRGKGRSSNTSDTITNAEFDDCRAVSGEIDYMYRIL